LFSAKSVVGSQRYLASSLRRDVDAVSVRREVYDQNKMIVCPCTIRHGDGSLVTGAISHVNGSGVVEANNCCEVGIGGSSCGRKANDDICVR
jgi:hypothetical protein